MEQEWIWDQPALERLDLTEQSHFEKFRDRYLDILDGGEALGQILTTAGNHGGVVCFVERDYIDRDYRDEYANFYAGIYRSLSDRCQRLHFVSKLDHLYLGFVVLRPIPGRLVCRTMLAPAPALGPFVSCLAPDVATVYGEQHRVRAAPFISQDFQYGVCAHASIWMLAQYFNLRFGFPRLHMSDIVEAASVPPGNHRTTPSRGLTAQQIVGAMNSLDMLPLSYEVGSGVRLHDAHEIARTYLDSAIPLLLTKGRHVLVLIGYFHDESGNRIYVAHDDIRGPHQLVEQLGEGERLLIPSPGRIYLDANAAESHAQFLFNELMEVDEEVTRNIEAVPADSLRLRAYLTEINEYRRNLDKREVSADAMRWLRMSGGSHWVWVVELQDRRVAVQSPKCVLGEMVVDATADDRHAHVLFGLMPGAVYRWSEPKGDESRGSASSKSAYSRPDVRFTAQALLLQLLLPVGLLGV